MGYSYQYGTSPRKLRPEEDMPPKKSPNKKVKNVPRRTNTNTKNPSTKAKKTKDKVKLREEKTVRVNFEKLMVVAIGCILFSMYRSVKINEKFTEIQTLSKMVSSIEKENSQLSVNIQNSLNLSNIESIASSTLGMQKLSSKQTIYVNLDTKDYTEISNNKAVKEEETRIFEEDF